MINIAILASGNGDSTEKMLKYFNGNVNSNIRVVCVISNEDSNAIQRLKKCQRSPKYTYFTKHITDQYVEIDKILTENKVHYIVLDNYSDKIPINFCKKYQFRIMNIHYSLLPKYNDLKGIKIHEQVKKNKDEKTGFSVYFVNEMDTEGLTIFQKEVKIAESDTVENIAHKVELLEEKFYPTIVEKTIMATYHKLFK